MTCHSVHFKRIVILLGKGKKNFEFYQVINEYMHRTANDMLSALNQIKNMN